MILQNMIIFRSHEFRDNKVLLFKVNICSDGDQDFLDVKSSNVIISFAYLAFIHALNLCLSTFSSFLKSFSENFRK